MTNKLFYLNPKSIDLIINRKKDRTRVCDKILGKFMFSRERQIEIGNSWFSTKYIQVQYYNNIKIGTAKFITGLHDSIGDDKLLVIIFI